MHHRCSIGMVNMLHWCGEYAVKVSFTSFASFPVKAWVQEQNSAVPPAHRLQLPRPGLALTSALLSHAVTFGCNFLLLCS